MTEYKEPTTARLEVEAQTLRIVSKFQLTIEQARDRIADGQGWVNWAHMLKCKSHRGAA